MTRAGENKYLRLLSGIRSRFDRHDILGMAAKTTYYLLLSFFPLILLLLRIASGGDLQIFDYIVPPSVLVILEDIAVAAPGLRLTAMSLIILIWSASTSIWALMSGIHVINTGSRGKLKKGRLRALLLLLLLALAVFICVSLTFLSGLAVGWIYMRFPWLSRGLLYAARVIFMYLFIFLFILSLYALTPDINIKARGLLPGAAFAALGWIIATWGFEMYMKQFSNYSLLYGSVGVFLGLALWLYIISIILFCGAEINTVLQVNRARRQ